MNPYIRLCYNITNRMIGLSDKKNFSLPKRRFLVLELATENSELETTSSSCHTADKESPNSPRSPSSPKRRTLSNDLSAWIAFCIGLGILSWNRQLHAITSRVGSSWKTSDLPRMPERHVEKPTLPSTQKILLFITTIFSKDHMRFFSCCWPKLMEESQLLPFVDVMVFTNNSTEIPETNLFVAESLFRSNPSYKVQYAPYEEVAYVQAQHNHNMFQLGANLGPKLGFRDKWFEEYDWVIRINPDVLIRNSTWILQTMANPSVEGIFVNCNGEFYDKNKKQLHTDFFAVRPKPFLAYYHGQSDTPFSQMELETWSAPMIPKTKYFLNHEGTAYKYFSPILQAGRYRYLPDTADSKGNCRVRGNESSVYHGHESCLDNPHVCDALLNWTIT